MKLAYLVNTYPRVSHSFIRRELLALDAAGSEVERFSIRSCDTPLVDEADKAEFARTRVILGVGITGMLAALIRTLFNRPRKLIAALKTIRKLARVSDKGMVTHLAYLAEACVLREWLEKSKSTHLHAHFGTNSAAVAMLCRQLGGPPFSFTVHGPEEFERATQIALAQKVCAAKFVVAISEFGKGQLCRWCDPKDWSKFRVVHCGVDSRFLESETVAISDKPRLVCVGRLCPEKGHLVLVEAAKLLKARGLTFELVLAGDGPLRPTIEAMIADYGLAGCVRITGWLSSEQVKQEILQARVMVLPSFAEGLPVVIMEALALGRPVISTPVAGIPELLVPATSGWLVQPGSAEKLADAMQEVLQMPNERLRQMGIAGAASVAERHDIRIEAAKLNKLFINGSAIKNK